jgi:adenine-specific DNA-methyltransferase
MIWNKSVEVPRKKRDETLTEFTERLEDWYIQRPDLEYRKERGQYFTPKRIGEFMIGLLDGFKGGRNLKILDPGAGVGIFESLI